MPDMICTELKLESFDGLSEVGANNSCIVDEDIDGRDEVRDLSGCLSGGFEGGEIEEDYM